METKTTAVETKAPDNAADQGGVKTEQPKAPEVEVDLLDEFQKVIEDNKKLTEERDNYKRGLLKRKKGEVEEDSIQLDEEEVERRATERANEILANKKREENEQRQREIALKALKENRELKTALKNSKGIVTTATGTSQSEIEKDKNTFWTPEQLAYFKKRNIDPEKVKQNYQKLKS